MSDREMLNVVCMFLEHKRDRYQRHLALCNFVEKTAVIGIICDINLTLDCFKKHLQKMESED